MPLVTSKEMLLKAQAGGYAVGAFNVENMEMAQAVLAAAQRMGAPVMVQTTTGTLKYAPPGLYAAMVGALAGQAALPVAMHLDHGSSLELAQRCLDAGYTSLMIDGSMLAFDANVALTRQAVTLARAVPVEGELGTLGGKEDALEGSTLYTQAAEAEAFVRLTGVSSLAVSIGSAHGLYKGEPRIDLDRLEEIRGRVSVPLVLHGGTGIPEETIKACIARGISKINFATDLRIAFTGAVKAAMRDKPDAFDPKAYLSAGRAAVEARVCQLIALCGCEGKA